MKRDAEKEKNDYTLEKQIRDKVEFEISQKVVPLTEVTTDTVSDKVEKYELKHMTALEFEKHGKSYVLERIMKSKEHTDE